MFTAEKVMYETASDTGEFDIFSLNAGRGDLFINGKISMEDAVNFASAMKWMEKQEKSVNVFISSPGGEVNAGLMIYDIIQDYPYELNVHCIGEAASMAAVILAGGKKGHRWILPHSHVMIHEPFISSGFGGTASAVENHARKILEKRELLNGILSKHTGRSIEEISEATSFDNVMNAHEAVRFGLCDGIRSVFEYGED